MANIPVRGTHLYMRNGNYTNVVSVTRMPNQVYVLAKLNFSSEPVRMVGVPMALDHPAAIQALFNRLSSHFVRIPTMSPRRNTLPRHLRTRGRTPKR